MATLPAEIWHEIFTLACTDGGLTGRSLSLVSKDFHEISMPVKYQSVAITRWGQLIVFSQTFSQLPDFQKKIKYLFIHCPYPFMDVEDNPSLADERCFLDNFGEDPVSHGHGFVFHSGEYSDSDLDYSVTELNSLVFLDPPENSDSDLEYPVSESDGELDSEFGGSLDSFEKQDVLEDVNYLQAVSEGLLPAEGQTREDEADYGIQAVFNKASQALRAILNETPSTLNILTLYWTSFRPLPVHHILPPLPFLDELHLFRCSVVGSLVCDDSSTTPLFPRLRLLFMSGDEHHRSVSRNVPKFAPNLTHFRFTTYDLDENDVHCIEDVMIETSSKWATDQIGTLVAEKIDKSGFSRPILGYLGELPEAWHRLWSGRVAGRPEAWMTDEEGCVIM